MAALVAGCGAAATGTPPASGSTSAPSGAAPGLTAIPSVEATTASLACPPAAIVDAALGVTVSSPISISGSGPGPTLPPGARAISCEYAGAGLNVLIELFGDVPASTIGSFSDKFPVPFSAVSGLGDEARSFSQALGGGKDNEGVVAVKGSLLVDITATGTPATLAQLEALVGALL